MLNLLVEVYHSPRIARGVPGGIANVLEQQPILPKLLDAGGEPRHAFSDRRGTALCLLFLDRIVALGSVGRLGPPAATALGNVL